MFKKLQFASILILLFAILLSACAAEPTAAPTEKPMEAPTEEPMEAPTEKPMEEPTEKPMEEPTEEPMEEPTEEPMEEPAAVNPDSVMLVTAASGSFNVFTPIFNPFNAAPLFPTIHGIFEPLMINNRVSGEIVPWLATEYAWSDDLMALTFTIRDGVQWSDGTDFTARDVVYTFNALASTAGLSGVALAAMAEGGYIESVSAPDDSTVVFTFKKVYTPGYYDLINQVIVPEHILSEVDDLITWVNEDPVGTGPFTEVVNFQDQVYQIDRNPNYWQPGLPAIQGLRMPAFPGNDVAATMYANGDTEWTGQFFPNVEEAILSKDENLKCWWPTVTSDQIFMPNNTVAPFDDPEVRKALSMGFDREQLILIAIQGTSTPGDVTALSSGYSFWKAPDLSALGEDWTAYNPDRANEILDDLGYTRGEDGIRLNKDGTPFDVELLMVNGFTDWLAVAPLLKQNIEALGFKVTINNYDVPVAFGKWWSGDFDLSLFFGIRADTPYNYYHSIFATELLKPVGENTGMGQNMWRYSGGKADAALEKFASTGDLEVQKEAALELQQIMHDEAPILSMWHAPAFACYSEARFTGFASADNEIAFPMPIGGANTDSSQLIQLLAFRYKE